MTAKRFIRILIILAIVCLLILFFFVRTAGQPQGDKPLRAAFFLPVEA
jgi:hypothetical protein